MATRTVVVRLAAVALLGWVSCGSDLATALAASPAASRPAHHRRHPRRVWPWLIAGGVAAGVIGGLAIAGRAGRKLVTLGSEEDFRRQALQADQPVLVMFHKTACPTCVALEPGLARLADEYRGRAVVARYKHLSPYFRLTSRAIRKQYRVYLVPTVILFVGGQERKRWFMEYRLRRYRKALDKELGRRSQEPGVSR